MRDPAGGSPMIAAALGARLATPAILRLLAPTIGRSQSYGYAPIANAVTSDSTTGEPDNTRSVGSDIYSGSTPVAAGALPIPIPLRRSGIGSQKFSLSALGLRL
jgi:hypothetical protein